MMPPDYSGGKCQELSPEEMEKTFFYPGPQGVATTPSDLSMEHWEMAKEICIECPIFLQCRAASWGQEYGVFGGTDQHERHLHRRRLTVALARKDEAERATLAAFFFARHAGGLGDSPELIARTTGYSSLSIKLMISEHEAVLDERRQRKAAGAASGRKVAKPAAPEFPKADPPSADGWVWYYGRAHAGHYVAQTEDGLYVRMKIRPARAQTTKWLLWSQVDLRTAVAPMIQDWIARPEDGRPLRNAEKTHCPEGHEYDEKNTYMHPGGGRVCRACAVVKRAERKADGVQEKAQDDQRPGQQAADAA